LAQAASVDFEVLEPKEETVFEDEDGAGGSNSGWSWSQELVADGQEFGQELGKPYRRCRHDVQVEDAGPNGFQETP
jgi:hypothetical protein